MTEEQREQIKKQNNKLIDNRGYRVNDWLPFLESPSIRKIDEIRGRISVMNALVNISFEAPVYIIKEWIETYDLIKYLSKWEAEVLEKENEDLTEVEINSLRWYLESLWALLWVTTMNDNLDEAKHVGDNLASLLPNLQRGQDNQKIEDMNNIQTELSIYTMLDYYYRIHWYCVNERLHGGDHGLNERLIYERRKTLEWVSNKNSDWDDIDMST